eukprot:929966-Pleurochrysis_carterae.AAC.1
MCPQTSGAPAPSPTASPPPGGPRAAHTRRRAVAKKQPVAASRCSCVARSPEREIKAGACAWRSTQLT